MAGRRQHFIPQFLQQGFASHTSGEATFTWVYRKGMPPFNANIINVGVEGRFYTEGDDSQADDSITDAENRFGELVRRLRADRRPNTSPIEIAELIAHLEIRTRHLRQSLLSSADFLVSRLVDFMADEHAFLPYLERQLRRDPSSVRQSVSEMLTRRGLPQTLLQQFTQLSVALLPEFIKPLLPQFAAALRANFPTMLRDAAKSGHVRALKETAAPKARTDRYKTLEYSVEVTDESLILGDSPVLFRVQGPLPYKTFLEKDDDLSAIVLPLSPQKVLIGSDRCLGALPSGLCQATARCSLEYFIAAERSEVNILLRDMIGEDAALLTRAQVEQIVTDVMEK
jgi:hypothetical protein